MDSRLRGNDGQNPMIPRSPTRSLIHPSRIFPAVLCALLAACAVEPPRYGEVVTMKASDAARAAGYPEPGTVWRLDESDLKALSPNPIVPAPPPPRLPPPPRPNEAYPPGYYYGPPPSIYWAPGY
jgi:hypothetical protein